MNLATTVMLYCALRAAAREPLVWPGTGPGFTAVKEETDVEYLAAFNVWAATTPECRHEYFNILNGDPFTYERLWPAFAQYFGCKLPDGAPPADPSKHAVNLEDYYGKSGLAKSIWQQVCDEHPKVDPKSIDSATWWFMQLNLAGSNSPYIL